MLVCKRHRGVAPVLQLQFQISQIWANQVSISLDGSWVSGIYQSVPTSLDIREACPNQKRSFFNIVQKGAGGGQTHVQNFCCKFCMILKAFWQHKFDIKILFRCRNFRVNLT